MPSNYVVDLAHIINNDSAIRLNHYLKELEEKTTAQMIVLTINSLDGESIEKASLDLAHSKWKLGQKGKDNGVLLLIVLHDRKYRFEIGYGLEGILPDSFVGSLGRQYLVPYFRQGDYSTGIYLATLAVVNEIAKNENVDITGLPSVKMHHGVTAVPTGDLGIGKIIFGLLFLFIAVILVIRHPWLCLFFLMGGGGRSGWGGYSGGGFGSGGFGGGGGGGFGGGGASGGW
jgi:uncharacterized protein